MLRLLIVVLAFACSSNKPAPPACSTDADCMISCGRQDECCPQSECDTAVPRTSVRTVETARPCSQGEVVTCPPKGARPAPRCNAGACVADKLERVAEGSAAGFAAAVPIQRDRTGRREGVDTRSFSRACKKDTDCRLVDGAPCNRCQCPNMPIASSDEGRFKDALASLGDCSGVTIWSCVDCEAAAPACKDGECIAKSTEPPVAGGDCRSDDDCVISCETAGTCCPMRGCETVVARSKAEEAAAFNREHCSADARARCEPATGKPEYIRPRCVHGKCFGQFLVR